MPEPITRAQDTVSLDNSPTMAMTTLYGAAVGPIGKDYYLPIFSRFEAAGQATLSWNLSACLYTVNWMIFRRLWGPALVWAGALLGSAVLLVALGLLVLDWPHELIYQLLLACLGLGMLASGLWGNALLYNHCRQAMMTAVADNKTLVQACAQLSQQAATRARFIRLLVANAVLLSLAAAAITYLMLWGTDTPTAEKPSTAPSPAVTASAAEPAASAASQVASAAQAPASTASAAGDSPTASPAEPASAPAPAAVASALPVSVPPAMPLAVAAATPASAVSVAPAASNVPTASSALAAPHAAASPAKAVATARTKVAVAASSRAASAARAKAPALAKSHASVAAHAASRPVAKPAAKPASANTSAAKTSQQAKATTKGIYINAGLFANPDNARNALAKLQAASMPATAQEIDTSQGPRTRIRVGPIATAMQAQATIEQIKALGLDAALVKP